MKWLPLLVALVVLSLGASACSFGCGGEHVDYTYPPVARVLDPADAVVRASVSGTIDAEGVRPHAAWIELDVSEILWTSEAAPGLEPGPVAVKESISGECDARQSGLFVGADEVIVVLVILPGDDVDPGRSWRVQRTLEETANGSLKFLDGGENLNQRIDEILPDATIDGLVQQLSAP